MMKHKTTACKCTTTTSTMLRASGCSCSSNSELFVILGDIRGLVWKIVSEIWLMVLITLMTFGVFDMFFHMANWEKTFNGIHQTIHQGFDHYPPVGLL